MQKITKPKMKGKCQLRKVTMENEAFALKILANAENIEL